VVHSERKGKFGQGFIVQDINAPMLFCQEKVADLKSYHKMVPHVKSVEPYEVKKFDNV
jgi:hypothetical protein